MSARLSYRVACLQLPILSSIDSVSAAADQYGAAVDYLHRTIRAAKGIHRRPELRLVLVPEFWLSGALAGQGYDFAARPVPGDLTLALSRIAVEHHCYIAANVIECGTGQGEDGTVELFDSAVVISDEGDIVLHYREVASNAHSGGRIRGPKLRVDGESAAAARSRLCQVADTELGRLALLVGSDIRYGTLAQLAGDLGAEVILHVANESDANRGPWQLVKAQRARENGCYVVSCNNAGHRGGVSVAGQASIGRSKVVDPTGRVIAETTSSGETVVEATISLAGAPKPLRATGVAPFDPAARVAVPAPLRLQVEAHLPSPAATDPAAPVDRYRIDIGAVGSDGTPDEVGVIEFVESLAADGRGSRGYVFRASGAEAVEDESFDRFGDDTMTVLALFAPGRGGGSWYRRLRAPFAGGNDAIRRWAIDGLSTLICITGTELSSREAETLRRWACVTAWENEIPVLVLGDQFTRGGGRPAAATRRTRDLVLASAAGEVVAETEIGRGPWTFTPDPPDGTAGSALEHRHGFRRELIRLAHG